MAKLTASPSSSANAGHRHVCARNTTPPWATWCYPPLPPVPPLARPLQPALLMLMLMLLPVLSPVYPSSTPDLHAIHPLPLPPSTASTPHPSLCFSKRKTVHLTCIVLPCQTTTETHPNHTNPEPCFRLALPSCRWTRRLFWSLLTCPAPPLHNHRRSRPSPKSTQRYIRGASKLLLRQDASFHSYTAHPSPIHAHTLAAYGGTPHTTHQGHPPFGQRHPSSRRLGLKACSHRWAALSVSGVHFVFLFHRFVRDRLLIPLP